MANSTWNCDCPKCGLEVEELKNGVCSTCQVLNDLDESILKMDEALRNINSAIEKRKKLVKEAEEWVKGVTA